MSNLSGNYKINAGEVHGVDVVREQERRARLQLLDEIREPSPQPVFGEPVKVELEDETSRRIKNTLGDFTQVLINDSKNLLGIAKTASSTSGHGVSLSSRNPSTSKRPPIANGMLKPSTTNIPKHPAPDKRLGVPRNKVHDSINCPPNSLPSDSRLNDQTQWVNHHRKPGAAPSLNGSSHSGANPNNPSIFPNSSKVPSNKSYPFRGRNGMSTTVVQAPRFGENTSSAPPPKRCAFRPSNLSLPERKPEKPVESPTRDQDLETILREMKQAVPPPLTAIQTPRTEESGFSFPGDPKEEVLLNTINELKLNTFTVKSPDVVPQPPEPPKSKEANSRQNTPSPLLKKSDSNMPAVVVEKSLSNKLESGKKDPDSLKLGTVSEKTNCNAVEPILLDISSPGLETEKATELLESLLNESDKCISSSLQEDLEMSDSDDEVITDAKNTESKVSGDISSTEHPKSSPISTSIIPNSSSTAINKNNMDVPQSVPSNSSSSESGDDSDSDDSSSSESNDSDSSASSDASDADTPSKMWGLSNFFDETRRNHSPAFVPMDTSTNSSTIAVKEDPIAVKRNTRENYSLVDEDSVHGSIREPVADPIPNFLELDKTVNIKNEILSPITSPLHRLGPSASLPPPPPPPPPQAIRGPRTPPSPTVVESTDANRSNTSSGNVQTETVATAEVTVHQSQTKHSVVQQNSCDMRDETGKVQTTTVKKRLSKKLSEIFSPRTESSPATLSFEVDEPSASTKGLPDVSLDKDENDVVTMTSSYSVPSETSESSHANYSIKTRQKVLKSSSAKKSKTPSGESLAESGQKGNNLSKSSTPKVKHPTRTIRASSDSKQLSKTSKSSTKSDQSEDVKKPVKSDQKDKSSSEKNKIIAKTPKNIKGTPKNSVKVKKKPPKTPPKQVTDGKKGEVKRKKNKFHIENFLQSPTISQSEGGLLVKASSAKSPSRDKSPFAELKSKDIKTDNKRRLSISPARASRSPSRSSSKSVERVKCNEKLRRSTRCSERASSIAQAESSAVANHSSETKKSVRKTPRRREHADGSLAPMETPQLLSPIPHISSPIPMTLSECAIPTKIIVSIPLDKLTRIPAAVRGLDLENKPASKRPHQAVDENLQKKESVLLEKSSKNTTSKRSVSKDIKDKPRTDVNSKSNKISKCALVSKKDKNVKALSEPSIKSKTTPSVNNKPSIKTPESKPSWDANDSKVSRKRKNEENKQPQKKKIKVSPERSQDKIQHASRTPSHNNFVANASTPKDLERCDSVSSLSSLGSQRSQRSSKEKRSSNTSESKKGKLSGLPVKYIKQEKEEKLKTTIKKEPPSPEKNKEKSRDKLLSKDDICDKVVPLDPLWNDASSQFSLWNDPCKEDSKGPLSIQTSIMDSIHRVRGYEWDSMEIKDLKEGSNLKHNNQPIMPMDYYYTEGRKQRHLAEREKDPFLQTLKYFEATVLFILTSQQREEYTKEPESVYQYYRETLNFSNIVLQNARREQGSPGNTEFKLLILLLRCQALLHVKLYNLKLKEIKEQQKSVSEFFVQHCQSTIRSLTNPVPSNPKCCLLSIPSPVSPTPSPASSVNSQTSGYSSSDVNSCHRNLPLFSPPISVTQSMLDVICRQHMHFINLHMGHDLWEQADMYMTRSNLREFFKEVADQSENYLTLHSSIKDLVSYVQTGLSLVKKCSR